MNNSVFLNLCDFIFQVQKGVMTSLLTEFLPGPITRGLRITVDSINAGSILTTRDSAIAVALMSAYHHYQHKATSLTAS